MELSLVKSIVESNLTSLNGAIANLDLNKFEEIDNGYNIEGTFRTTFGMYEYNFHMILDQNGKIKSYEKTPRNNTANQGSRFDRITIA